MLGRLLRVRLVEYAHREQPQHSSRQGDDNEIACGQLVSQLCRRFGKFRPRFTSVRAFENLAELLALLGNEDAISLRPMFVRHPEAPNVVIVPIADEDATWDVFVAWQRGKIAAPVRALVDALAAKPGK